MVTDFAFQPGILDYWMLLTDWRNGSFAILLAVGVLLVGFALATRNRALLLRAGGACKPSSLRYGDASIWRSRRRVSPERPSFGRRTMFGIDWLREGGPVDKKASVSTNEAEVVAGAQPEPEPEPEPEP